VKIYKGKRTGGGIGGQAIVVQNNGDEYPLKHIERHSPDGFQWGYGGSGPADTALAILTDLLGMKRADLLYQLFKWEFVACWGDEWSISEEKIREWVEKQESGLYSTACKSLPTNLYLIDKAEKTEKLLSLSKKATKSSHL